MAYQCRREVSTFHVEDRTAGFHQLLATEGRTREQFHTDVVSRLRQWSRERRAIVRRCLIQAPRGILQVLIGTDVFDTDLMNALHDINREIHALGWTHPHGYQLPDNPTMDQLRAIGTVEAEEWATDD